MRNDGHHRTDCRCHLTDSVVRNGENETMKMIFCHCISSGRRRFYIDFQMILRCTLLWSICSSCYPVGFLLLRRHCHIYPSNDYCRHDPDIPCAHCHRSNYYHLDRRDNCRLRHPDCHDAGDADFCNHRRRCRVGHSCCRPDGSCHNCYRRQHRLRGRTEMMLRSTGR